MGATVIDDHVPKFAGKAPGTAVEAATKDEATADAGARGDMDQVVEAAAGPIAPFGKRGGTGVILDKHRNAKSLGNGFDEGKVAEARDVGRDDYPAAVGIDEACTGNGTGIEGTAGGGRRPLEQVEDDGQDAFPLVGRVDDVALFDDAVTGDDGCTKAGASKVSGKDTRHGKTVAGAEAAYTWTMARDLEIRDFEPRDLRDVLALNVRATDPNADPMESARTRPELLNIPEHFQGDGAFLTGFVDDELVAMGSVRPESGLSYRVDFLRVAMSRQRRGYGRALMAALEGRAAMLGAHSIVLDTTAEQVAGQRLFAAIGYRESGRFTVQHEGSVGDREIVRFRKDLEAPDAITVELEDWQWEMLDACRVAHLATIAKDGRPHLVPVVYAVVDEGIAIAIDEKPKATTRLARLRNIERDPRATLLFDRYDEDWSQLAWLRIDGDAEVLDRGDEYPDALIALRERYPQYDEMALEDLPLIIVVPVRVVGWQAVAGE